MFFVAMFYLPVSKYSSHGYKILKRFEITIVIFSNENETYDYCVFHIPLNITHLYTQESLIVAPLTILICDKI